MDEPACPGCRELHKQVAELAAQVAELTRQLEEAVRAGKLKQGDVTIFVAFGAGLTWANAVVRM